jgi:hypothetical protein
VINKFFCVKMKKAEIPGRLRAQKCPEWVKQDFLLSELAKVFIEEENPSKLSAFFDFCLKIRLLPHLRAQKTEFPD